MDYIIVQKETQSCRNAVNNILSPEILL